MRSSRIILPVFLSSILTHAAVDWPDFRGPTGDGHVPAVKTGTHALPLHWSETNHVKWKTEVPLHGISTPVILDGQVWITTAEEEGHDFYVLRYAEDSGQLTLNQKLFHADNPEPLGNGASMNSYATPSSVAEPGRVYVHFGSFGTACLDSKTGAVLWKREDLKCRHYRGASSCPVLFENLVILTFDGADQQYLAALDKKSGETVWTTKRSVAWNDESVPGAMAKDGDLRKAHSTPLLAKVGDQWQLLSGGAKACYGYDPATGRELWRVQYNDWSVAPRPLFANGLAYFVTGLVKKELIAVNVNGSGDVTDTHIAWRQKSGIGKYSSPIMVDGLIYTAADESFLSCVDASSGQVVWTERVGGKFAASPVYDGTHLYFLDQTGKCLVVKPGRSLNVVATNNLSGTFMASPAVSGESLFLRSRKNLYRIDL